MHIDRVQPSQNLHATLSPLIAALDYHERAASVYSLRIGVRFIMRHTQVCERIKKVFSFIGGVPLNGRALGRATLRVIKSEMDIVPCKAVLEQLLHHTLSVCKCVIEGYQCLCHRTSPSCIFISVRYNTLNLYLFAAYCDTLWLVRLEALLTNVDLLP